MSHGLSSERAIENLIARYSFLVDDGDFAGLGELLGACAFTLGAGPAVRGREAIAELARAVVLHGAAIAAGFSAPADRDRHLPRSLRTARCGVGVHRTLGPDPVRGGHQPAPAPGAVLTVWMPVTCRLH
ncbi:MAG TPA: nuclear transport factor 2 family protein [Burkholderiaceae bacterium]